MNLAPSPYLATNVAPQQQSGKSICLTMFRGEHGEGVLNTRLAAYSFGPRELAEIYALEPNRHDDQLREPKIITAKIFIENPFVDEPTDPFLELGHIARKIGVEHAVRIAKKFDNYVMHTNNWEELSETLGLKSVRSWLDDIDPDLSAREQEHVLLEKLDCLYFDGYPYFDDQEEVQILRDYGFDGACMGSAGAGAGMEEYRVFDPEQIEVLEVESLDHRPAMSPY